MKSLFENEYKRADYLEYLQTYLLPNDFETTEENVTDRLSFEPGKINDITFLGESAKLDLAVYEMQHDSENDPRVTISRDAFKILANFSKRRALVLFAKEGSSNYRLSLITIDLKLEGKKVTKIFSNPRRYSYLLGSDAKLGTLFDKLVKAKNIESTKKVDNFDDLLSRFAVEPVTKEFFNKYKTLYENVIEEFEKSNMFKITIAKTESFNSDIFARKLLGQITFLYFLQKKKWLGGDPAKPNNWKDGKQDFLRWGFKKCKNEGINYFDIFLEKLFYEGLNMEGNSFKFNDFFLKVPYLNGGLFECPYQYDELVVFSPDDKLFSNEEETGILDIFDQYNFTIDENTFFEQDIAIDPEMLGKVFENLLDDINRKGKGAFYTPREIVNYMTRESLKQFLITKLQEVDSVQDKLEHLFEYKDLYLNKSDFADNEHEKEFEQQFDELFDIVERIDEFLAKIKIADPAIGSGAFPMGILHEIVSIRSYIKDEFLNEHVSIYALKKETIQNCIYGVDIDNGAIEIAKIRFWLSLVVDAEEPEPLPNFDYKFMQGNSLIESFGGININQVRTKYSDLSKRNNEIDEEISNINSKIEGLQKQFFKEFSETSSQNQELLEESKELDKYKKKLLSEKKKLAKELNKGSLLIQEDEIIDHLHFLQERLYFENDKTKKKQFRDEIEDTIVKIFKCRIENEKADYFNAEMKMIETANQFPTKEQRDEYIAVETKELKKKFKFDYDELEAQLHEFTKKDKIRPFFPWHLYFADVFKENNGFDIVIGNPPYVSTKGTTETQKKDLEQAFGFADDLYSHFYFKGLSLTKNQTGFLSLITSKTFWTIQTKRNLRELFLKHKIHEIYDTANPFEAAMVDTCILSVSNKQMAKNYDIVFKDGKRDLMNPQVFDINSEIYKKAVNNVFFKPSDFNMKIYHKFNKQVADLMNQWWDKIKTSRDITKNQVLLEKYRNSLKPGDVTLLGLVTDGGQGLATANNGKFVGVLENTKIANRTFETRPEKFLQAVAAKKIKEYNHIKTKDEATNFINSLSEIEIRNLFDGLKEKYGRDIFGQGYLFRIVSKDEIADIDTLSDEEKKKGISGTKCFVPYDKGDKDGNRWYLETPYYIDWNKENVEWLKHDPRARWQGYDFFFRKGFCWSDIHTILIKTRIKTNGIHDVKSMSLFSNVENIVPEYFIISLLNSTFISEYDFNFVNSTQTFQINDARQLPIIVPTDDQLSEFKLIFDRAVSIKKEQFSNIISESVAEMRLEEIQKELDEKVLKLYGVEE